MQTSAIIITVLALALPSAAAAHRTPAQARQDAQAAAISPAGCGGQAIAPDQVITGSFTPEEQGGYVLLPFDVPAGTTQVRVKYCYDQPEAPTSSAASNTLDLGVYEARESASALYGPGEFRGWGGSSHPDVALSAQGFSTEAQYKENPKGYVPGRTTRGFRPGPIEPGQWAAELGVAAVTTPEQGNTDGKVDWRVEIELREDAAFAQDAYRPARYDTTPAKRGAGWYAGDLHVHAEHSSLGDAPMSETFDYAFKPIAQGGAGLDFITLTDYVSDTAWGEIGRFQGSYPGKLIARGAEVITYRGHMNNQGTARYVDYRTGPVYERAADGRLVLKRAARPASATLSDIRGFGGWTQINHPTIFPSSVPLFALLCRGCPWDYSAAETRYRDLVDAIEIATGPSGAKAPGTPGFNPFTVTAIDFYESALRTGAKIAAVGSSDSHNAGRTPNAVTQAPIGEATTVVYADELSEKGIQRAIQAGRTYVKITGNDGPDLRFEALAPGQRTPAIMGDTVRAERADFTARVIGADPASGQRELLVVKDGAVVQTVPVNGSDFSFRFASSGYGRYRLQLQRGEVVEAVSSPIYLEPPGSSPGSGPGPGGGRPGQGARIRASLTTANPVPVRGGAFRARCKVSGGGRRTCAVTVRTRERSRRAGAAATKVIGRGSATLRRGAAVVAVRLTATGRRLLARRRQTRAMLEARAAGPRSTRATARRAVRLRAARR